MITTECPRCESHALDMDTCATCLAEGDRSAICPFCREQCRGCRETVCSEHVKAGTLCPACYAAENGPEDVITEDHWQARSRA